MKLRTCNDCEYMGDAYIPCVKYFVNGQLTSEFIGFTDRYGGNPVEHPARHCEHEKRTNITIYDNSSAECCIYFKPKTWDRPLNCAGCTRHKNYYTDGRFACNGYPFYRLHNNDENACINGKQNQEGQIKIEI